MDSFGRCHAPIWNIDDFSACFQHEHHGYTLLSQSDSSTKPRRQALDIDGPHEDGQHHDISGDCTEQDDDDDDDDDHHDDDELSRNTQLALDRTVSQAKRTITVEGDRPKGESSRVVIELLATSALVAIHAYALKIHLWRQHGRLAAIAGVIIWAYTLLLVCARLAITVSKSISFPTLWYHTAVIYALQWLPTSLIFRSYVLYPPSEDALSYMLIAFILNTILLVIALASRKGNKPIELEYEGNIPPAREPVASIFSLATFSWFDPVVWTGYKKTLELDDVWNLAPADKAAHVLAAYRHVKKTTSLAWHLLSHFKPGLIEQAMWSVCSGFLTFVPTLLLRAILQYVENPLNSSRSAAWFFVTLLFVSGCASALADGMALWIGRKTCIRLRAVIIGELYAKALRRKVGASADAVLGSSKKGDQAGGSWWSRLLGRSKKKSQKPPGDEDSSEDSPENAPSEQVTSGAIINLMAVDSFKVSELSAYLHFLWASTPVQVILAVVLLYSILGYSSIAGIGMMVVLLPVNMFIARQFSRAQKKILAATDARIDTTNEVLTNIRIIKYFAWEQRFMDKVDEKRVEELRQLRKRYILWSFAATVWGGAPMLITFLSFAIYTLVEGKALVPSIAFTALSLFQILRIPLDQLADMVAHVQESRVSVDRIEEFLNEDDTQKYKQLRHHETDDRDQSIIGFDDGTFTWATKSDAERDISSAFRMMDLNLRFANGKLNVIAGSTGSGKTSLLMALLGEMTCLAGKVHLPGGRSREDLRKDPETGLVDCVAYCAQQAWLVNDTVKGNIVFASPWDAKRYNAVIRACSLQKDFEILDHGDATWVGEKGVTLSGGQKQRISLARALYSSARHLLLDDILSAVDSHTAKWIFEQALTGPLMANRTCILVTHNVSLCLPKADFAVLLDNGRVTASGTALEVINSGVLSEDLTKSTQASTVPSRVPSPTTEARQTAADAEPDAYDTPATGPVKAAEASSPSALEESKASGSVNSDIILMYLRSMGPWWYWALAAATFAMQQASNVSTNVWIRQWANAYSKSGYASLAADPRQQVLASPQPAYNHSQTWSDYGGCLNSWSCSINMSGKGFGYTVSAVSDFIDVDAGYYLAIYGVLSVIYMLIAFFREAVLFYGSLEASKKIHLKLMNAVSRAKFRFFDTTPLGQLMNRFSKDIENVDQEIAPVAVGVVHCLASIVTIVVLISVITPGFLVAGFFITVLYFLIGKFYIGSSRDLKRIESVQRSPLYQQFGETLSGMITIRAYGDERRFIRENLNRVNTHNRPFLYLWAANRWLAFRVDVVGALVSFFAGVFVILSVGRIDAGAAGLAMSYAVTFTENVLWFVRLYATNEQNMNSVERIKEYLDVEQEAPAVVEENRPPANWPSQGAVEFINYSTRYRTDFDLVLRNLSLKIAPCEKVGVVGRTGAGKSSLALSLFRALEAEEGKILIDNVDIGLIGLQDLRENIVMVPQDPTLFSGTIRSNLDPFNFFKDDEIFTALRRVQLIGHESISSRPSTRPQTPANNDRVSKTGSTASHGSSTAVGSDSDVPASPRQGENKNIFTKLSSKVAESGSNLSQGQRQLLCLARALLKAPRVLLMDEATASIDYATDSKIQETIRELKDNTIITIAHRLKTIVDYDKVVVMERGRVVEMGAPWQLLQPEPTFASSAEAESGGIRDPDGRRWFREMCETSGEFDTLLREAKKSWEAKHGSVS